MSVQEKLIFNVPNAHSEAHRWIYWCYNIVKEFVPEFLNDAEFNKLYNEMVSICDLYSTKLKHQKITDKYDPHLLQLKPEDKSPKIRGTYKNYWRGYIGYFEDEFYSLPDNKLEENRIARNKILDIYIKIHELISPHLLPHITPIHQYKMLKRNIGATKRSITMAIERIAKIEKDLENDKKYKENLIKELATLEEEVDYIAIPSKYK